MSKFLTLLFVLIFSLSRGQEQWFPAKADSLTGLAYPDTSHAFPVPYICCNKLKVLLYAYKSPYPMEMKLTKEGYYSDGLRIAITENTRSYAFAKYYFQKTGDKGILIIKRSEKTDTINFIKSKKRVNELKYRQG